MDYGALRSVADSLITDFSNGQSAILLKGEKVKDPVSGRQTVHFREVPGGLAVMTNYSEEAVAASNGVIGAGDVKFVCRFPEPPTEVNDRIRYAGEDYNVLHCRPINPAGDYVVTYVIQGRKA